MAVGVSAAIGNQILDAMFNNVPFSIPAVYLQLHDGDPGPDGTDNIAAETDRVLLDMSDAAGGVVTNNTAIEWNPVTGTESTPYFSLHTAVSAGTFIASGTLNSTAHQDGTAFLIEAGQFVYQLNPTAA